MSNNDGGFAPRPSEHSLLRPSSGNASGGSGRGGRGRGNRGDGAAVVRESRGPLPWKRIGLVALGLVALLIVGSVVKTFISKSPSGPTTTTTTPAVTTTTINPAIAAYCAAGNNFSILLSQAPASKTTPALRIQYLNEEAVSAGKVAAAASDPAVKNAFTQLKKELLLSTGDSKAIDAVASNPNSNYSDAVTSQLIKDFTTAFSLAKRSATTECGTISSFAREANLFAYTSTTTTTAPPVTTTTKSPTTTTTVPVVTTTQPPVVTTTIPVTTTTTRPTTTTTLPLMSSTLTVSCLGNSQVSFAGTGAGTQNSLRVVGPSGAATSRVGNPVTISVVTQAGQYTITDSDRGGATNISMNTQSGTCSIQ